MPPPKTRRGTGGTSCLVAPATAATPGPVTGPPSLFAIAGATIEALSTSSSSSTKGLGDVRRASNLEEDAGGEDGGGGRADSGRCGCAGGLDLECSCCSVDSFLKNMPRTPLFDFLFSSFLSSSFLSSTRSSSSSNGLDAGESSRGETVGRGEVAAVGESAVGDGGALGLAAPTVMSPGVFQPAADNKNRGEIAVVVFFDPVVVLFIEKGGDATSPAGEAEA